MSIVPDPEAEQMAQAMIGPEARDVMQNILHETLLSADSGQILESGRTACNNVNSLRAPLDRYPTAVDLNGCPVGQKMGIWHSHVTPDTLKNPTHSLPDYANVILGHVDVSVVVGSESAHVVVSAADRDAAHAAFEDALGFAVDGPGDVVDGREHITDYMAARKRVERALSPLNDRVETGFDEITAQIEQLGDVPAPQVAAHACMAHADAEIAPEALHPDPPVQEHHHGGATVVATDPATQVRERARQCGEPIISAAEGSSINIQGQIVGSAIGIVVGRVVEAVLFPGSG